MFEKIDSQGLNGAINNCTVFACGTFIFKFYYATQYYQALTFTSFSILIRLEYEYFLKKRTTFRKQFVPQNIIQLNKTAVDMEQHL